jgi:hypothetical protein
LSVDAGGPSASKAGGRAWDCTPLTPAGLGAGYVSHADPATHQTMAGYVATKAHRNEFSPMAKAAVR